MGLANKLLKSSLLRTADVFLQIAAAFAMTPYIVHSLGDRMYGFWVLVGTFLGYYGLLDLGLSSAVTRYISRAVGMDDRKRVNEVVNTAIVLFSIVGIVVLIVSVTAMWGCHFFIGNPVEVDLFRKIVAMLGISIAVGFPVRVLCGVLDANIRFDLLTYASSIKLVVVNILIIVLLRSDFGILALASASFMASMLEYVLIVIFAKKTFPDLQFGTSLVRRSLVNQLYNYSGKTFIAQLGDLLRFRVDTIVIAGFLNAGLVTYYSIGQRFVEYFSKIMVSATGIMSPVFSQYEGRGDYDSIRKRFLEVTHLSVILSVFIGASIMFYSKWFIARWMGPGYESSYYVCLILCVSSTVALMQTSGVGLLYGISKHNYYAIANTCEGIINLVLSLILVRFYGIYGVALGTTIAMFVFKLLIQPIFVCRAIELSIYRYYVQTILSTATKSLAPLLLYFFVVKDLVKAEYSSIFVIGVIQSVIYAFVVYMYVLGEPARLKIRSIIELKWA